MPDIDLINALITDSLASAGVPASYMVNQDRAAPRLSGLAVQGRIRVRMPRWSEEEEAYVKANLPYLPMEEIAASLGRSQSAVKCRGFRMQALSPRYAPGYVSGNQIAKLLGVDNHKPPAWIDRGILDGEPYPYPESSPLKRRVRWMVFLRFLIRPTSWVYFDVAKVKNDHLRRLVELAQAKWGDKWLNTREAATLRGCELVDVQNAILHGRLPAFHAGSLDRKRTWGWAHWFVKESDALSFVIKKAHAASREKVWSPGADAFIARCYAEGVSWADAARMMKVPEKAISYHARQLKARGMISGKKVSGQDSARPAAKTCIVCLKPNRSKGQTCGSKACKREMVRRHERERYVPVPRSRKYNKSKLEGERHD